MNNENIRKEPATNSEISENCDKPEVLAKFQGCCSDHQILDCHGKEMIAKLKEEKTVEKDCDQPKILAKFQGDCSDDQIRKCHGQEMLENWKCENKL